MSSSLERECRCIKSRIIKDIDRSIGASQSYHSVCTCVCVYVKWSNTHSEEFHPLIVWVFPSDVYSHVLEILHISSWVTNEDKLISQSPQLCDFETRLLCPAEWDVSLTSSFASVALNKKLQFFVRTETERCSSACHAQMKRVRLEPCLLLSSGIMIGSRV